MKSITDLEATDANHNFNINSMIMGINERPLLKNNDSQSSIKSSNLRDSF